MTGRIKKFVFDLLGKDPEGVIVTFATGTPEQIAAMYGEIQKLVPNRRHILIEGGDYLSIRAKLSQYRIAQACVMFNGDSSFDSLRWIAFALAPSKILAFNSKLERHHLRPSLASLLFVRGVPKDYIFHRPWSRTEIPAGIHQVNGNAKAGRPEIAIVTPYLPWPMSHGGAVRMYYLIREAAREFNIHLVSFGDETSEPGPLTELCSRITLTQKPIYRKPKWWGFTPAEVREFISPAIQSAIRGANLVQLEYTQMASYRGDILVEHDVTFDLAKQVGRKWNYWRWKWFETRAVHRYRRVAVMSEKDHRMLGIPHARVIPNGVDLTRFTRTPEPDARRLLFVSSFAHFPNMVAYRFFIEEVWPHLHHLECIVVAGRDPQQHWQRFTGQNRIPQPTGILLHEFVADVKPLYDAANIVIVPTLVSAGTNLKVLEGMAAGRAIVSTPSGVAGIGLTHGVDVLVAESGMEFAQAIMQLLNDPELRTRLADNARKLAEERYGWDAIGQLQAAMWRELLQ